MERDFVTPDVRTVIPLPSPPSNVSLTPYASRLDVRATRAAFAAGTLGTVGDHASREDREGNVETGHADRHNADDVQHPDHSPWTERERQAFLRRVQYVDPRERRA